MFDLIREEDGFTPLLWSQRYKANLAKLVTGDIYQGAEVVRALSLRESGKGLSGAEKRRARQGPGDPDLGTTLVVGSTKEKA